MKKTVFILLVLGISLGLYAVQDTSDGNQVILKHYILAQEALAVDNFELAKSAIGDLAEKSDGELKKLSTAAFSAADLKSIREAFKPLSKFVTDQEIPEGLARAYCPMVKSFWLQKEGDIANPYFGESMLSCGVFK